jgi:hypothetical protein
VTPALSIELRATDDGTWVAEHGDGTVVERETRADALVALDAVLPGDGAGRTDRADD